MRNRNPMLIGVLLLVCIGTVAATWHYRSQAQEYQLRLEDLEQRPPVIVREEAKSSSPYDVPAVVQIPADEDAQEQIALLQQRIIDLEDELARRAQVTAYTEAPPPPPMRPDREFGRERQNWMEELRRNDPEGYEEIQKRREQVRQEMHDSLARKAAYLLYRDKANMSENEREQHALMMGLLSETWTLFRQLPDISREERREVMGTLRENVRTLEPMLKEERERAFFTVGKDLGYGEEEAKRFAQHMDELVEVTTLSGIRFGPPFGGGPPGR